eukprot:3513-Heterococcus_DN1.PRE.2
MAAVAALLQQQYIAVFITQGTARYCTQRSTEMLTAVTLSVAVVAAHDIMTKQRMLAVSEAATFVQLPQYKSLIHVASSRYTSVSR